MKTLVKVRPNDGVKVRRDRRVRHTRQAARRDHHSRIAPPATQRLGQRRPGGVRGPQLVNPARIDRCREPSTVPPVNVGTGMRLTDRGLALAMALMTALVIAAVVCITTTAARVTAEPAGGGIVAASAAD